MDVQAEKKKGVWCVCGWGGDVERGWWADAWGGVGRPGAPAVQ